MKKSGSKETLAVLLLAWVAACAGDGAPYVPDDGFDPKKSCGDGFCLFGEQETCPEDCEAPAPVGDFCGNWECEGGEDSTSCPIDCGSECGDALCAIDETGQSCAEDCAVGCGDGICAFGEGGEDSLSCPADCGSECGDGVCQGDESSLSCSADCGDSYDAVCGDGFCGEGEDVVNCRIDCRTSVCGNGSCDGNEDSRTCHLDCGSRCGDGICNGDEDVVSCNADCGLGAWVSVELAELGQYDAQADEWRADVHAVASFAFDTDAVPSVEVDDVTSPYVPEAPLLELPLRQGGYMLVALAAVGADGGLLEGVCRVYASELVRGEDVTQRELVCPSQDSDRPEDLRIVYNVAWR